MLPIQWRAEAQADLAAILDYVAERNLLSALNLYEDIERAVSQLPHHPYLYRLGRVSGTRELVEALRSNVLVALQIPWNQAATIRAMITSSEQEVAYSALNQARQGSPCCENQAPRVPSDIFRQGAPNTTRRMKA
jgi:toxin ParE1/3/4